MGNVGEIVEIKGSSSRKVMPHLSLNHVSFVCRSVAESVRFYEDILGFVLIKRPSSFKFEGAWLFNYGVGIHILEAENVTSKKDVINPKDNHISFECSDMSLVVQNLEEKNIKYVTATVEDGGVTVDQLFFHDPDGYMIEICNCQNLPVLPISACPLKLRGSNNELPSASFFQSWQTQCSVKDAAQMMENLVANIMEIWI